MERVKIKDIEKMFSEYRDEYVLECLQEGKNTYEPEAYSVLLNEAEKRDLFTDQRVFYDEAEMAYRKLIKIFEADDIAEADHVTSLLSIEGIYSETTVRESADSDVAEEKTYIFVFEDDEEHVIEIIERFLADMGLSGQ
ncbi:MAG: hypothetical protein GY749_15215 [Desulfobacteraceae bacterium]|nr:hypothetical protein [Desulfobacteraceae bacterium]